MVVQLLFRQGSSFSNNHVGFKWFNIIVLFVPPMTKVSYPQITLKVFTKKILKHISQGVAKLSYEVLMGLVSDIFKDYELIVGSRFTLAEEEAVFEFERLAERKIQGSGRTNVRVPVDLKIEFNELSEKSGIPIWKIVDHGLRNMIKYEYFSGTGTKWKRRIRDALAKRVKSNLKKIQFVEAEPVEEIPAVVERARAVPPLKAVAMNRTYPLVHLRTPKIRLMLTVEDWKNGVRRSLDAFYRWSKFNVGEVTTLMSEIELNRNPVNSEVIIKNAVNYWDRNYLIDKYLYKYNSEFTRDKKQVAQDLYELLGIEWDYPPWMKLMYKLIDFWNRAKNAVKMRSEYYTYRMCFEEFDVEVPDTYLKIIDEVIYSENDIKRTGIPEALDLRIKTALGIEDQIEYGYKNFKTLSSYEKTELRLLIKGEYKNHSYAQLIREELERDKSKNGKKDSDLT